VDILNEIVLIAIIVPNILLEHFDFVEHYVMGLERELLIDPKLFKES
jgi:hypothetical protein